MDRTLIDFIRALRNSDVRVSTSESMDAFRAVRLIGYDERSQLKEALSITLAKSNRYSMAMIDMHMPEGKGVDLIRDLRNHIPHTKFILIGEFLEGPELLEATRGGVFMVTTKPICLSQLSEITRITVADAIHKTKYPN